MEEYWPYLVPLVLLQLGVQVFYLADLHRRERVRGRKAVWAAVVVLGGLVGSAVYAAFGREDGA